MKKSLIKKFALVTGAAVAFSSFAVMTTGCSDKKDDDKEETKKEESAEETKAEETETPETEAPETEAPETEVVVEETDDVTVETDTVDVDTDFEIPEFDVSVLKDEELQEIAADYVAEEYMIFTMEEFGEELPEGVVDGFVCFGSGEDDTIKYAMVFKCVDLDTAVAFVEEEITGMDVEKTETDDGVEYTFVEEGIDFHASVTNDGLAIMEETQVMSIE